MRNKVVKTSDAPAGAITTEKALREHLSAGKPLWEGVCGGIWPVEYQSDWEISDHKYGREGVLFLYPSKSANDEGLFASALTDRHIDHSGRNDNWWFDSPESAEAYKADRAESK